MSDLRVQLERLLANGGRRVEPLRSQRVVVYGAGNCGRGVAQRLQKAGYAVAAFLDARAARLSLIEGVRVLAPDGAETRQLAREGCAVVIGIFNYATDIRPVLQLLQEAGFAEVLSYPEFHQLFGDAPDFWLTKASDYAGREEEILNGFDSLGDEHSRAVFRECIQYRLTFAPQLLTQPDTENHYLPNDLPPPTMPLRMVDGGAFTGDTLRLFLERGVRFQAVAAFEPDPQNFRTLRQTAARALKSLGEVTLWPCGLGEQTSMHSFQAGVGASSAVQSGGTSHIQVVSLDDVLPAFAPNFIKLDIEGAEPLALRGARETIQRHQPRLAVCVYHAPDHLWSIPRLVRELNPDYELALRYHQLNGFDVVLYALRR